MPNAKNDIEELKYQNASTYLNKFKKYDMSLKIYQELSNKNPNDPIVWVGLLKSITNNFTNYKTKQKKNIKTYYQKYIALEKDKTNKEIITKEYNNYMKILHKKRNIKVFIIILILVLILLLVLYNN